MRCGLFGKLPVKRDFVAVAAPRPWLDAWEPWMQGALSASREALKKTWQNSYLKAPIWRFWLGADICGASVMGALMPSLDGVGRYYPLTVFAVAEPDALFPPPDLDPQDPWFSAVESFLLSTLAHDVVYEKILADLERLKAPTAQAFNTESTDYAFLRPGAVARPAGDLSFSALCSLLRTINHDSVYAAASFWWTLGGGEFTAAAISCRGMPDPFLYSAMLTGQFKPSSETNDQLV
jgi:type VI secretion system protein ImpM